MVSKKASEVPSQKSNDNRTTVSEETVNGCTNTVKQAALLCESAGILVISKTESAVREK